MKKINRIFASAALGAGVALTSLSAAGCAGLVPGVVTATVGNNNPFTGMISAKEALERVRTGALDAGLGEDQKKLVYIISKLQNSNLGREMTQRAADFDYYYAVHNHIEGGGVHIGPVRVIALELVDDGVRSGYKHDDTKNEDFLKDEQWFRKAMAHELTHLYQERIWKNMDAPVVWEKGKEAPTAMNSFDQKLWGLAVEGQADLFSIIVNAQIESKDIDDLNDIDDMKAALAFGKYIVNDDFHPSSYGFKGARCDDGRAMTAEEFNKAFGNIPGKKGNFLTSWFRSRADIYAMFALNPTVLAAAKRAGCPMNDPPPEPEQPEPQPASPQTRAAPPAPVVS